MIQTTSTQTSPLSKMFTFRFPDGTEVYSKPRAEKVAMHMNNVLYEYLFTNNICNNPYCTSTGKRQIFDTKILRASHALNCTIKQETPQIYNDIQHYLKENVKVSKREESVKRSPMKKYANISTINGGGVSIPPVAPVVSSFVAPVAATPSNKDNENVSLDIDSPTYMDSLQILASQCHEEYLEELKELNGEFQNKERSIIRYEINKLDPLADDYYRVSMQIREQVLHDSHYFEHSDRFHIIDERETPGSAAQYNDTIDIYSPTAIDEIRAISESLKMEYKERHIEIFKKLEDKRRVIIRREIVKLDPMNDNYEKLIAKIREKILHR